MTRPVCELGLIDFEAKRDGLVMEQRSFDGGEGGLGTATRSGGIWAARVTARGAPDLVPLIAAARWQQRLDGVICKMELREISGE